MSVRYIAQVNSIAASKEHSNPYLSHRLFHSSPKPPVTNEHFSFQANILQQDEYVISLLSQKTAGVASSTEKVIAASPAPSLSPAVNMAGVINAAAHTRNAETEKAALKEIVPLLEKRPNDVGLILTIAHLYIITTNYAAATYLPFFFPFPLSFPIFPTSPFFSSTTAPPCVKPSALFFPFLPFGL